MPNIAYIDKNLGQAKIDLIETANDIIAEYQADGYALTLRQLYYQLVARAVIPNSERSYKNLGSAISDGRLVGLIDWRAIEDRTRNLVGVIPSDSPEDELKRLADRYTVDRWDDQPYYIEVWVEKEALSTVVERPALRYQVDYFCCRGYVSQSEMWNASQRLKYKLREGKKVLILHLGDHDPSGLDMTRDIRERFWMFLGDMAEYINLDLRRIALNMDQIEAENPPPNPTKLSDVRARGYVENYGYESWELDALPPAYIDNLIESYIRPVIDWDAWRANGERQDEIRDQLREFAGSF